MSAPVLLVEFNLNGVWTTITDQLGGYHVRRGIFESGPNALLGATFVFDFTLNNRANNSGTTLGWYSLSSPNKRTYFKLGIYVRARLTVDGSQKWLFYGTLDAALPEAGKWNSNEVKCTAIGWLGQAAEFSVSGIPVQENQSESELLDTLVAAAAVAPPATDFMTGQFSFDYALDSIRFQATPLLTEFQRVLQACRGHLFEAADGTLTFHTLGHRVTAETNVDDFSDVTDLTDVTVVPARSAIINKFLGTVHPRKVGGAATTVLMQFQSAIRLTAGISYTVMGAYVDVANAQEDARVAGTDFQALVSGTDYAMFENADGSGANRTASLSVTVNAAGNGAQFVLESTQDGYVTLLQLRGRPIYDFQTLDVLAEDATSQADYGERKSTIDLIYQSDLGVGRNLMLWYLGLYKDGNGQVVGARFTIPRSAGALAARVLSLEIGDRIGLAEQVTGIAATDPVSGADVGHFVNGIDIVGDDRDNLIVTLSVAPASSMLAWKLAVASRSELGGGGANGTCCLGFGGLAA
jgi:hypothetical protein